MLLNAGRIPASDDSFLIKTESPRRLLENLHFLNALHLRRTGMMASSCVANIKLRTYQNFDVSCNLLMTFCACCVDHVGKDYLTLGAASLSRAYCHMGQNERWPISY